MAEERQEREETGRKGGAAAMAGTAPAGATAREVVSAWWTRDRVRWGPVWAGFLIALGIQLVLGAIGLAVALSSYDPATANYGQRVASTLGIWSAVSLLIALFVGGYVAGRLAAIAGIRNGVVQGSVVWALALVAGTVLSALGIGGILGSVNLSGMMQGLNLGPNEARAAAEATRNGALYFAIGSVLAWLAAAGGGSLGAAQREEEIEEM